MAQKQERANWLYDGCLDFSEGIDSGISPPLLQRNQCAFAVNSTFRGDYVTDRPPVRKLLLDPVLNAALQGAFGQGLYQGASAYKSDISQESIVCSLSGRLFQIFPSNDPTIASTGSEITIPGDPNPPTQPQAWLWQAERWLIVQDGLSDPIFYDGVSSRRSEVAITVVGTTAANFTTIPPIGGTVVITLTQPFSGLLNSVLTFNEMDTHGNIFQVANYEVIKVGGNVAQYQVVLQNLADTPGTIYSNNTNLIVQPANLGRVTSEVVSGVSQFNLGISAALPTYVVVGNVVLINGVAHTVVSIAANRLSFQAKKVVASNMHPNVGDQVILQNYNAPNVVVGTLESSFTAPLVGSNVTVFLQAAFQRGNGTVLFVGNGQYQVVSSQTNPPAPSTTVTLLNINDPGVLDPLTPNTFLLPQAGSTLQNLPELPPGRMGDYGMGRVWQSGIDGISFIGGDLVGGASGSGAFNGRDAVLKVTSNTMLANGGAFRVPGAGEIITGMKFSAILDTSLGQGPLQVFTNKNIFSCNTPSDNTTWENLTYPILTETLKGAGASSHYGIVPTNSDLIFRSPDGQVRSEILSRLDFNRWGNTPISFEMTRVLDAENLDFMNFCSGIEWDNRLLMTCDPVQINTGVYWRGIMALNFDPLSVMNEKTQSIWEGVWVGLNVMQLVRFSNVERAFALCVNPTTNAFEIYEILPTGTNHFDNNGNPITWIFESPMLFHQLKGKDVFDLLKLQDGEMYVSDVIGKVVFTIEYRPDFDACWHPWHSWFVCAAQGTDPTQSYPQYRSRMGFGMPPNDDCNVNLGQPPNYGTMFQLRITVSGHCVINGFQLMATLESQPKFSPPICNVPNA